MRDQLIARRKQMIVLWSMLVIFAAVMAGMSIVGGEYFWFAIWTIHGSVMAAGLGNSIDRYLDERKK